MFKKLCISLLLLLYTTSLAFAESSKWYYSGDKAVVKSGQVTQLCLTDGTTCTALGGGGSGDVIGAASSIDSEIALFSGTTGKIIKAFTGTGILSAVAGVISASLFIDLGEISAPGSPPADTGRLYAFDVGGITKLFFEDSVGTITDLLAAASSGAPTDATYITQIANATLTNEQALGALATGMVKNQTTTGVLSIGVAGTDYTSPSSTESPTNKTIDADGTGNSITNIENADIKTAAAIAATKIADASIDNTEFQNLDGLNQTLATTDSPEFAGQTLTGFAGIVKATAGVLSAVTDVFDVALKTGRDADNNLNWGTDDQLDINIAGATTSVASISTGTGDNDKLATQGYIDDAITAEDIWDRTGANIKPSTVGGILNVDNIIEETASNGVQIDEVLLKDGGVELDFFPSQLVFGEASESPYVWYHFNASTGTTSTDSSDFGRDGANSQMDNSNWVTGHLNNALTFNGTNERVDVDDIANFERTDAFAGEAWIDTSDTGAQTIFGRQLATSSQRGWIFHVRGTGKVALLLSNDKSTTNDILTESGTSVNTGSFVHVAFSYDGSSAASGVTLWVNGIEQTNTVIDDGLTGTTINSADFNVGARNNTDIFFDGEIDEVVVYDAEIDQTFIDARYNSGTGTETIPGFSNRSTVSVNSSTGKFDLSCGGDCEITTTPSGSDILLTPNDSVQQTQGYLKLKDGLQDDDVTSTIALGDGSNTSFDTTNKTIVGSVNEIDLEKVAKAGDTMTGDLAMGANNITMTGSLSDTTNRVLKGWFTDLESTNEPTINGGTIAAGSLLTGFSSGSGTVQASDTILQGINKLDGNIGTKQDTLTFGILNTNSVIIDSASVADDEYARFTADGLESMSTSEVLADIGAASSGANTDITSLINASLEVGSTGTRAVKGWLTDLELTNPPTIGGSPIALSNLNDVTTTTPLVDQVLKFNGAEWVNGGQVTASGGSGISFYMDDTNIIPTGTNNDNEVNTLTKEPAGGAEDVDTISCSTNTVFGEAYLYDTGLGGSTIDAGEWGFKTYASVSATTGGRVSSITRNLYVSVVDASTITTTGTGTSRTATSAGGTPFVAGDANADITLSGYLQTPQGLYQITGYTSPTIVTIETPTTYTNESTAAFSTWKYQFGNDTGTITSLTTNYALYETDSVQSSININATDELAEIIFGTSNNTTDVNFVHNGTEHYSHFHTPLITRHNDLPGLQGGTADEYYHLSLAQSTIATQAATTSLDGYLTSTDWDTFNGKQDALTFGIADTNSIVIDDADAADTDYCKLTSSGIQGRSVSEVKTDLSLNNVENTAISTWAGSSNLTALGTILTGVWNGTDIAIADGGTGQSTAQAAIDALTQVSGATNEHVLTKDTGSGNAVWKAAAGGGGDVSKVGTPVNNQMPVWTGDGTVEGTPDFTYDETNLNLVTAKNFQIAGSTVLADVTGTTTLSNVDAIDATTESTIEAAIDALVNLVSIQNQTVTLGNTLTVEAGGAAILNQDLTTDASPSFGGLNLSDGDFIKVGGANALYFTETDGDNYMDIGGSGTGDPIQWSTAGTDANIDFRLSPKGTGELVVDGNIILNTGNLGETGNRIVKGWFTDIESTNMPIVGGISIQTTFADAGANSDITSLTGLTTALSVAQGGTGRGSATAYSVLAGGTTTTGAQQSVSGVGTSNQVLTSNGASALPTWQDISAANTSLSNLSSAQLNAAIDANDKVISKAELKDYSETVNAIGSIGGGTQDIDYTLGSVVTGTVDTSTTTFTFSNPPTSGKAGSFTLILTNGGSQTVAFPASVDWSGGTSPTLTTSGVDTITFITTDAGTTWLGFLSGLDMK